MELGLRSIPLGCTSLAPGFRALIPSVIVDRRAAAGVEMRFLAGRRSCDSGRPPMGVVLANIGMVCLTYTRASQLQAPPRRLFLRYGLSSLSGCLECNSLSTDGRRVAYAGSRRRRKRRIGDGRYMTYIGIKWHKMICASSSSLPTLDDDHLSHRQSTLARPIGAIHSMSREVCCTPGFMSQKRRSST